MAEQSLSLELRSVPTQARSKQTFEHILNTSAFLLEEVGFEAFNTNLLAKRANLAVRAIYRYFPNKFALVHELAKRMELSWRDAVIGLSVEEQSRSPWPEIWPKYLDCYIDTVRSTPGGVAVLRAMKSHPNLRAVDEAMNDLYIKDIARTLQTRNHFTRQRSEEVATLLLTTTVAVIDATLDASARSANRQIDLLKVMHNALLQTTSDR